MCTSLTETVRMSELARHVSRCLNQQRGDNLLPKKHQRARNQLAHWVTQSTLNLQHTTKDFAAKLLNVTLNGQLLLRKTSQPRWVLWWNSSIRQRAVIHRSPRYNQQHTHLWGTEISGGTGTGASVSHLLSKITVFFSWHKKFSVPCLICEVNCHMQWLWFLLRMCSNDKYPTLRQWSFTDHTHVSEDGRELLV